MYVYVSYQRTPINTNSNLDNRWWWLEPGRGSSEDDKKWLDLGWFAELPKCSDMGLRKQKGFVQFLQDDKCENSVESRKIIN